MALAIHEIGFSSCLFLCIFRLYRIKNIGGWDFFFYKRENTTFCVFKALYRDDVPLNHGFEFFLIAPKFLKIDMYIYLCLNN